MTLKSGVFELLAQRLDWLGQRQGVIAQNLANADTANYRPKDISENDFRRALKGVTQSALQPRQTRPGHMVPGGPAGAGGLRAKQEATIYEESPSGNAVVLENELVKMGQTQAQHELVVALYKKYMTIMKTAVGAQRR